MVIIKYQKMLLKIFFLFASFFFGGRLYQSMIYVFTSNLHAMKRNFWWKINLQASNFPFKFSSLSPFVFFFFFNSGKYLHSRMKLKERNLNSFGNNKIVVCVSFLFAASLSPCLRQLLSFLKTFITLFQYVHEE